MRSAKSVAGQNLSSSPDTSNTGPPISSTGIAPADRVRESASSRPPAWASSKATGLANRNFHDSFSDRRIPHRYGTNGTGRPFSDQAEVPATPVLGENP